MNISTMSTKTIAKLIKSAVLFSDGALPASAAVAIAAAIAPITVLPATLLAPVLLGVYIKTMRKEVEEQKEEILLKLRTAVDSGEISQDEITEIEKSMNKLTLSR